jgi:MoxR-like ATPase
MIDYPSESEEAAILKLTTKSNTETVNQILSGTEIIRLQQFVRDIFISDELIQQVNLLVRSTRPANATDQMVKEYVDFGAGPRAGQAIILAAKAHALIRARLSVTPEDIRQVTLPALRHRLLINFKAESDGITTDHIIKQLIDSN